MSMQSHLVELERKHRAIESEIHEVVAHPSADTLQVAELKRRKLHLKDEIERIKTQTVLH